MDKFLESKLKLVVIPGQSSWPKPEYVHWQKLHACADMMRGAVGKAWNEIDQVERDPDLSVEGRKRKAREIGLKSINDLQADKSLMATRDAVDQVIEKWRAKEGAVIKRPVDTFEANLHREIRSHVSGLDNRSRMKFIEQHADDVQMLSALLTAPPYLSNLSPAELALAKAKASSHLDPQIVEARDQVKRAMAEIESHWPKVLKKIGERAGLVQDVKSGVWVAPPTAKAA